MGDRRRKEAKAVGLSLLFLAAGFVVVWLTNDLLDLEGDAVLVSLLLIPVLLYLVLSGTLQELKGPGGLELRFADVAQDSVRVPEQSVAPSIGDMALVEKGPVEELEKLRARIDEARPTVMTIQLGGGQYNVYAVVAYLDFLSKFRNFKFVVFLKPTGRFVAYMPHWAVGGILRQPELGTEFIDAINENREGDLLRYPGIIQEAISSDATNAEAIREMEKHNLEALLVVDNGLPKGVVEREQILSRMILALT